MTFHISVICADPAVEATLAAALDPAAIAESPILHAHADLAAMIGEISWLCSTEGVSPRSDLAIVYGFPYPVDLIQQLLPIFSHKRLLILTGRGEVRMGGPRFSGPVLNCIVLPFDPPEVYLRIYHMLKDPHG
ncbi:MAG TPA: hypothetical protein VD886_18875 [Herpetosiphonaceae bacterium]|nr:hypothetical protein [Herpetosiphonaceae bacterium]